MTFYTHYVGDNYVDFTIRSGGAVVTESFTDLEEIKKLVAELHAVADQIESWESEEV